MQVAPRQSVIIFHHKAKVNASSLPGARTNIIAHGLFE